MQVDRTFIGSRDSSVGIATRYGLDGPGIEFRWGRDISHSFRPTVDPLSLLYNGYLLYFSGLKRPERDIDHSPPSRVEVKERLEIYLYSPSVLSW